MSLSSAKGKKKVQLVFDKEGKLTKEESKTVKVRSAGAVPARGEQPPGVATRCTSAL
jgi:hypothetical protein